VGDGGEILATALLLLLASPLLGAATLLALRKAALPSLRQLLVVNLVLTALTATAVTALSVSVEQRAESTWRNTTLRVAAWSVPGRVSDQPPWWTVTLSVGVDRLNRAPLCWLAWGALAAGLITRGQSPESSGRYAALLALEAAWLWTYAAQDGVLFLGALVTAGVMMAMLTAYWGREDRRAAAARLWRWWLIADGLLLLGLLGLANAAVWSQQHLVGVLPPLSMTWEMIAEKLPRITMHNQSAAQYWAVSAGWWVWPLVLVAAIRSGVPPFHSAVVQWWEQVSAPVGVLTLLGGLPLGWYLWIRLLSPIFVTELYEQGAVLAGWGALATLGAGMLCLAQNEGRPFAAWFSLAGVSLAWFLLSSGDKSAWDAGVSFAWGSAALLALVGILDGRSPASKTTTGHGLWSSMPRWSAAMLVTIGSLVGFPAAARWVLDWQLAWRMAGARPGPFFVAMTGWLIAGWAAVWMLQRWLWSHGPTDAERASRTVDNPIEDLRPSEAVAIVILLVWLGLLASGWLTAALDVVPDAADQRPAGGAAP